MIKTARTRGDATRVTFAREDCGTPVSVVGDFNQWDPEAHPLRRRSNGTRSVAVDLPAGRYEFRYLYGQDRWASEDGDGDANSVITIPS